MNLEIQTNYYNIGREERHSSVNINGPARQRLPRGSLLVFGNDIKTIIWKTIIDSKQPSLVPEKKIKKVTRRQYYYHCIKNEDFMGLYIISITVYKVH